MDWRRITKFVLVAFLLAFLFVIVVLDLPAQLVEVIGAENAYLIVFLIAALGGVSTLTSASYFSTVIAFGTAGLNPFLLGLVGGLGVTIGDSLFFLFGSNGRVVLSERVEKFITALKKRLDRFNKWSVPLFVYLYAGFTPFPNEFMTVSVGLTGAKYREIIIPLVLGNITVTTITVLGAQYAAGLL